MADSRQLRAIVLMAFGAGTLNWTVDRDCTLVTCQHTGGTALVSRDPAAIYSTLKTPSPTPNVSDYPLIAYLTSDTGSGQAPPREVNFPLVAGEKVYVAFSANSSVILWLADNVS